MILWEQIYKKKKLNDIFCLKKKQKKNKINRFKGVITLHFTV